MTSAIGIDLGTTKSTVGYFRKNNKKVIIVRNDDDARRTPSVVAFSETCLVGEAARDQFVLNPDNTVTGFKKLLGRTWSDPELQKCLDDLSYEVVEKDRAPKIHLKFDGEDKHYPPELIAAIMIKKLKDLAESKIGIVDRVVIAVPAAFDSLQRKATIDAANVAGFTEVRYDQVMFW